MPLISVTAVTAIVAIPTRKPILGGNDGLSGEPGEEEEQQQNNNNEEQLE
jgi:hypothetical protein